MVEDRAPEYPEVCLSAFDFQELGITHRPYSSSFSGLIIRILPGIPKKELWDLWVGYTLKHLVTCRGPLRA